MDWHDARVLKLAGDLRLLDKPAHQVGVIAVLIQQDLYGQVAAQPNVATFEHDAHAATSDLAQELQLRRAVSQCGQLR